MMKYAEIQKVLFWLWNGKVMHCFAFLSFTQFFHLFFFFFQLIILPTTYPVGRILTVLLNTNVWIF